MKTVKVNLKSRQMLPQYTDEQLTWLAERVGLTLAQLKRLHGAAWATYQAIGYDLAQANEGKTMKREDLVEVVLDASYMETYGNLQVRHGRDGLPAPELVAWLKTKASKYKLEHVYEAVGAGFPFAEYE